MKDKSLRKDMKGTRNSLSKVKLHALKGGLPGKVVFFDRVPLNGTRVGQCLLQTPYTEY